MANSLFILSTFHRISLSSYHRNSQITKPQFVHKYFCLKSLHLYCNSTSKSSQIKLLHFLTNGLFIFLKTLLQNCTISTLNWMDLSHLTIKHIPHFWSPVSHELVGQTRKSENILRDSLLLSCRQRGVANVRRHRCHRWTRLLLIQLWAMSTRHCLARIFTISQF